MTLTEFLLARIAEQEARLHDMRRSSAVPSSMLVNKTIGVALAECEAKRRIVESYVAEFGPGDWLVDHDVLRLLALPYADHPDYRQKWRP